MMIAMAEGYPPIEERFSLYIYDDSYYMRVRLTSADLIIQIPEGRNKFVIDIGYDRHCINEWRVTWYADTAHGEVSNTNKHCEHNLKWRIDNMIYDEFTFQRNDAYGTQFIHAMRGEVPLISTKVHTQEGPQTLGLELNQNNIIMYRPDIQVLPMTPSAQELPCKKKRK